MQLIFIFIMCIQFITSIKTIEGNERKKIEERKNFLCNFVSIEHLCSRMYEFRHHEKSVCTILDMTGTAGCHIFALEHSYITEFTKIVFNG